MVSESEFVVRVSGSKERRGNLFSKGGSFVGSIELKSLDSSNRFLFLVEMGFDVCYKGSDDGKFLSERKYFEVICGWKVEKGVEERVVV